MGRSVENLDFFTAGGPLSSEAPSYVKRAADDELLCLTTNSQFAYVFAPHHMGKSSLMVRTVCQLQQQEIKAVTIDLDGFDPTVDSERVYLFLLKRLNYQLQLPIDPTAWWSDRATLDSKERFVEFLHDVLLAQIDGKTVIFVDGVNSVASQVDFFEDFFSVIYTVYQARSTDPVYNRLSFVLFGTALPEALVKDQDQSPFKLGQPVNLNEFDRTEAELLEQGLQASCSDEVGSVFDRIFYWTNGHPYLTQKLCLSVARMWDRHWNTERVDSLVDRLFSSSTIFDEPALMAIESTIQTHPQRPQLLTLYRQIHQGKEVPEQEQSPAHKWLKVIGLARSENGLLKSRNQIYPLVFNLAWIKSIVPLNLVHYAVVAVLLLVLLTVGIVGYSIRESQRAAQAQTFIQNFREATSPEERIINLAKLFNLGGFEEETRALFYEELSSAEQSALFEQVDPSSVGEQLVIVIKGLYTDPKLKSSEQGNELLRAMVQPLTHLESSPSLGAIELKLEITQWLRGREEYYPQGQYQRAIDAYNIALTMNDSNPGTYYDRGLAYAALGDSTQAFADFSMVLSIDDNWRMQVEQSLISNSQLYTALWSEPGGYEALIALVPTPTNTPTPTHTPTLTPTPTSTSTPVTPTFTPTDVPTATSTPLPTSTPTVNIQNLQPVATRTPTPGTPTGTLTLLAPTLQDVDSYGPTVFKWHWVGTLPPGYGFEVRVWREGEPPAGAHNAILDNQNGNIKSMGDNTYQLDTNITAAAGVEGKGGIYLWTVAVVQVSPGYEDIGLQAEPFQFRFTALGGGSSGGGGGSSSGGGGGGVGID